MNVLVQIFVNSKHFLIISLIILIIFCLQLITFGNFVKVNMFLISFQPLFIILVIKFIIELFYIYTKKYKFNLVCFSKLIFENIWLCILIYLAITPLFALIIVNMNKDFKGKERANKFVPIGENIVSYVMTYIVPLTTLSIQSDLSDIIGNVILFFIIMILYIRLDLTYLNPVLILLGYNIYKIYIIHLDGTNFKDSEGKSKDVIKYIITKKNIDEFNDLFRNGLEPIFNINSLGKDLLMEVDDK